MSWFNPGEIPSAPRQEPKIGSQRGGSSRSVPSHPKANRCGICGFRIRSEQHEKGKHHNSSKKK